MQIPKLPKPVQCKYDYVQAGLREIRGTIAQDPKDPNCESARQLILDMAQMLSKWADAHLGGENG